MTRWLLVACLASVGCAANNMPDGGGFDAGPRVEEDSGPIPGFDAGEPMDAGPATDGGGADAGPGTSDGGGNDGGSSDAGPGGSDAGGGACMGISAGSTVGLDGIDDISKFAAAERLTPGGLVGVSDELGITWDADYLYVALSAPFRDGFRPLHVYVEASSGALGTASTGSGKEYDSLTAQIGFTPTHLIALRPTNAGGGMNYNGIWSPATAWSTQQLAFTDGVDAWTSTSEVSARIAWSDLGCPTSLRLTAHVVHALPANEWKDFVPLTATPWMSPGGGYYEIDLSGPPAAAGWTEVP